MTRTGLSYLPAAALAAALWAPPAMAAETDCTTPCEQYEYCAGRALQAIYDGVFSDSGCSDYTTCGQVVEECRREVGSCEQSCTHDYTTVLPED